MRDKFRLLAMSAVAALVTALVTGCGPDEVDAASDAEAALSARTPPPPPLRTAGSPGASTGSPTGPSTGPPVSAPPQMKPGQGMASVKGRTTTRPNMLKDEELPP